MKQMHIKIYPHSNDFSSSVGTPLFPKVFRWNLCTCLGLGDPKNAYSGTPAAGVEVVLHFLHFWNYYHYSFLFWFSFSSILFETNESFRQ